MSRLNPSATQLMQILLVVTITFLWVWPAYAGVAVTVTAGPPPAEPIRLVYKFSVPLQASAKGSDSSGKECILTASGWNWTANVSYAAGPNQPFGVPPANSYSAPVFDASTKSSTNMTIAFNVSGYWKVTPTATDTYDSDCGSGTGSGSTELDYSLFGQVTGPQYVPGNSQYSYNLILPSGIIASGINWTPGSGATTSSSINFSNVASSTFVTATYSIDGTYQSKFQPVSVVQITIGPSTFTSPGVQTSSCYIDNMDEFQCQLITNPIKPSDLNHYPGSDVNFFQNNLKYVSKGSEEAYEITSVPDSHNLSGPTDPKYITYASTSQITLTPPTDDPDAVSHIEIGYIQKEYEYAKPVYPFGNGNNGTRTTHALTTDTNDWYVGGATPYDSWPWYDSNAMRGFINQSGAQTVSVSLRDSPEVLMPKHWNPFNTNDLHAQSSIGSNSYAYNFNEYMAARTTDTDNNANQNYFAEASNYWVCRFLWPVVSGRSLVSLGSSWRLLTTSTPITVNVPPTYIAARIPYLTCDPDPYPQ